VPDAAATIIERYSTTAGRHSAIKPAPWIWVRAFQLQPECQKPVYGQILRAHMKERRFRTPITVGLLTITVAFPH
jgi:hypothetical protein